MEVRYQGANNSMKRLKNISIQVMTVLLTLLIAHLSMAALAPPAPYLSVHESLYGTEIHGTKRQSVQRVSLRIDSYADPKSEFIVQCFFLKKGKPDDFPAVLPIVDDTVIFGITPSHAYYEVTAKPLKLSVSGTSSKSKSSKKKAKVSSPSTEASREGYIVRILNDGIVLRSHYSGYQLEKFAMEHPEVLDRAAAKKSARHLDAGDLLKR